MQIHSINNKHGHKVPGNTKDQIRKRKIKNKTKKHFENLKNLGKKGPKNEPKQAKKTHFFIYMSIFFHFYFFF